MEKDFTKPDSNVITFMPFSNAQGRNKKLNPYIAEMLADHKRVSPENGDIRIKIFASQGVGKFCK